MMKKGSCLCSLGVAKGLETFYTAFEVRAAFFQSN